MPELKHHFRAGKMNKDLDERLVPNGEYRDAQNIEISTSEGDDVGTIQNVRGTTRIKGKVYNSNTKAITSNWDTLSFGLTNAICVGSKLNNENDRIYWFIKADEADCIAEYDDIKGIISPVLVDTNNILKFKTTTYITGVNVVDGMLLWTDNETEPKKIDIEVFKSGCASNFTTHTTFHGSAFVESDITVAKKAPLSAPTLTMSTSTRGGNGTGTSPVIVNNSTAGLFADADGNGKASGTAVTLTFSPAPNFQVGDIITLTTTYEEASSTENYEIKVRITSLSNGTQTAACVIQSIPVEVPYVALVWEALLSEEGVLFEKKMVRFGYRWKYSSGEYSVFSPFSELAFKPTTFEYLSSDGHNVGMINNLRQLTINITDPRPADVEEIDVLYKESNNNLVYVVDTLKENTDGTFPTSYNLESEIIGKVVEANQMLRPWDNVPRKAKAQEVTANRLIFANYLENYNIPNFNLPDISMAITQSPISTLKEPELSIKSLRTYQAGVVYVDAYNRQTPVFTSNGASKQTSKTYAETVNSIQLTLNNTPPSWATHFKYYIKETSNEYYNLSMDRYYLAEDGNVWLSFPSSERNKIQEDSYLILKKQHDSDTFVGTKARYKVLDISNDAPDFIKLVKKSVGSADAQTLNNGTNRPQIGSTSFKFTGPNPDSNPSFGQGFNSDGLIQLVVNGQKTEKYNILSGGPTGTKENDDEVYSVSIDEPLKEGETMLNTLTTSGNQSFEVILYEEKFERKPEFYGRFFAKINRDSAFDTNIIETYPDVQAEFGITNSETIHENALNTGPGDGTQAASWYDTRAKHNKISQTNNGHPVLGRNYFTIYWTASPKSSSRSFDKSNSINSFLKNLSNAGTLFRFKSSNSNTSEVYKVTGSEINYAYRRNGRKRLASSKRRAYKISFEHHLNQTPYEDSFTFSSGTINEIQVLEKVISGDNEILTSNNPAIWETEPKEAVDLDLYYETGDTYPIAQHGNTHTILFKNCYSFGNGVESDRLRDDYNAVKIDKGVKVSTVLAEQYKEDHKKNSLIYSGLFNSTSGINRLNQFIQGEKITKDINPHYGSIQKLHARNTDLITFCEDKVIKILANKDALFNADGNPQLTSTNRVLGQAIPFVGEYGISKNPESFASYAYRVYFADKNRGAILRLSRDGLTPISDLGMKDFFKDTLPKSDLILGSYDDSKGLFNLTLDGQTVSFDEKVNGFPSFKSFIPEGALSLNNIYYSIKNGDLWSHTNEKRNRFYDTSAGQDDATKYYESSVNVLVNDQADSIKGFKTVNYSGSRSRKYTKDYDAGNNYNSPSETFTTGWYCKSITTDEQSGSVQEFKEKEGRWYNYIKGEETTLDNLDTHEFTAQGIGNLSAISGDTTPDDKTVTVTLTGIANTTSLSSSFDVAPTTEIHSTKASITIKIVPNTGSTVTAGDLSVSNLATGSYVDTVAFAQNGTDVIATVNFEDGVNMPNSNVNINLSVTGDGVVNKYQLNDLVLNHNNDSNIVVTTNYNGSGNNETANPINSAIGYRAEYLTQATVATKTFNLNSNFVFKKAPSFIIEKQDDNNESKYVITFQDYDGSNTAITVGSGGKTLADVDKRIYTIQYLFPAQHTDDDVIRFNAESAPAGVAELDKITGYRVDGSTTINRFGTTKNVNVYGKAGAKFTFALNIDNAGNNFWDGDSFEAATVAYKGKIRVARVSDTSKFKEYEVTNVVDGTGYWKLTVQNHSGSVSPLSTFPQGDDVVVSLFDQSGTVYSGLNAKTYDFEQNTGDSDPGAGKVKFNQTALQNVTIIYIDEVDKTSANLDAQFTILSNTSVTSATTLTIPSSGIYTVPVTFPQTSTSKAYVVTLAAVSPTTLASPLMGNIYDNSGNVQNPFTINQYGDVALTLGATSSDLTVTSSNVVKTYTALGYPVEDSDFFVADLNITATASGNITKTRDPELEDFTNYNSNDFDWDFDLTSVTVSNTSPKTITIAAKAYIERYGSANTTANLNLDSFTSVAGGSSGGGSIMLTPAVTGSVGGIIIARLTGGSKTIPVGTSSGTNYSGTGTIFGNFYNNNINQVTLTVSATSSSAWNTSNITVTKGTLTQIDPSSYDLTYTWSGQLDEQIDSSSDLTFTVNVALANEP